MTDKKTMLKIEESVSKFFKDINILVEGRDDYDIDDESIIDDSPNDKQESPVENEQKPDIDNEMSEPVIDDEPDDEPDVDDELSKPGEDESSTDDGENHIRKGLNKEHKSKLRKWLLTNKKLNNPSFQGLVDQMDIDFDESNEYIFKIASVLLKQHLEKK